MDFFALIAPVYDRLIPVVDLDLLRQHLKLPCNGLLVDLGGGTGAYPLISCRTSEV